MADQREDLYATRCVEQWPRNMLDVIRAQRERLIMRGLTPIGISLSLDVWLDAQVAAYTVYQPKDDMSLLFDLPVTIIGDKNGVIAWSLQL